MYHFDVLFAYIPHGHCYLWQPNLVLLHLLSDFLIAIAYYSIPIMLVYFIRNRADLPFSGIFWLFSAFIIACGTTHIFAVWTLWYPIYWISGVIKAVTAVVSLATAIELYPIIPQALALQSPEQLQKMNQELEQQIAQRHEIEKSLRDSQKKLQAILDYSPAAIYLKDRQGRHLLVSRYLCNLLGKAEAEIVGKTNFELFPDEIASSFDASDHQVLTTEQPLETEEPFILSRGVRTYFSIKFPIYDEVGELNGVYGISTDITDRKQIEGALRQSEERYRAIVEDQTELIARFQPAGIITFVNPAYCRYFHKKLEDIINQTFHPVIFPEDQEKIDALLHSLTPQNPVGMVEHRVVVQGEIRWMQWINRAIYDATGSFIEFQAVGRDITERKQAEEALQESERLFRAIFNQTFQFIALLAPDGTLIRVNQTALSFGELNRWDVVGRKFWDAHWWKLSLETQEKLKQAVITVSQGKTIRYEVDLLGTNLAVRTLDLSLKPLQDDDGNVVLLIAEGRDITEQKQMIARLSESEESFRQAFDNAPIGIALVSTQGKWLKVNPALCKILGYSESELQEIMFQMITYPDDLEIDLGFMRQTLAGEINTYQIEKRYIHKLGHLVWVLLNVSLVRNGADKPVYFISQIQDITQRKQSDAQLRTLVTQLERSNQELQDFAYVASHDLQEPLRKIQAFGDRFKLKYQSSLDAQGLDYLARMQSAAHRMQALIQDLLAFSRITTKAQPFVTVNLSEIIEGVLSDLEVRIAGTGAKVEVGQMPSFNADPLQMRQLFQNLISNALKFNEPERPPHVKIYQNFSEISDGIFQIQIEDNGIGFDEKYLDLIFAPFQRLHGRHSYEGTGMGLAICRKIVERHGGQITARSIPGQGSIFIVQFPVCSQTVIH